jgi:ATP adenylyltransferase
LGFGWFDVRGFLVPARIAEVSRRPAGRVISLCCWSGEQKEKAVLSVDPEEPGAPEARDRAAPEPDAEFAAETRYEEERGGAGIPDGFRRLWTPHRMAYIKGENKPTGSGPGDGCPFCEIPELTDEDGLIVARGQAVFAVLNLYPYNSGHLMVCPYRHVADYTELDDAETLELAGFTKRSLEALRKASGAQGFNIGLNLGGVAGAGIAAHLHQHVVPRWGGDTNFMPVVGRTRVLPQLLRETRALLADAWPHDA